MKMKKPSFFHEQEIIGLDDGRIVHCDKSLVELVRALNNAGIITLNSCEGGKKYYIKRGKRKVWKVTKAYLNIDLRSLESVGLDHDFLAIEWSLKNPRKNWKEALKLRKERGVCLKNFNWRK